MKLTILVAVLCLGVGFVQAGLFKDDGNHVQRLLSRARRSFGKRGHDDDNSCIQECEDYGLIAYAHGTIANLLIYCKTFELWENGARSTDGAAKRDDDESWSFIPKACNFLKARANDEMARYEDYNPSLYTKHFVHLRFSSVATEFDEGCDDGIPLQFPLPWMTPPKMPEVFVVLLWMECLNYFQDEEYEPEVYSCEDYEHFLLVMSCMGAYNTLAEFYYAVNEHNYEHSVSGDELIWYLEQDLLHECNALFHGPFCLTEWIIDDPNKETCDQRDLDYNFGDFHSSDDVVTGQVASASGGRRTAAQKLEDLKAKARTNVGNKASETKARGSPFTARSRDDEAKKNLAQLEGLLNKLLQKK